MILEKVVQYCQSKISNAAQRYLDQRGVSDTLIAAFGLGYCPFEIDELISIIGRDNLIKEGLLFETEEGKVYSLIRNTIVFPFVNQYGKVVSISFRPMQSNEVIKSRNLCKYWHTSFEKGLFLYGLNKALPAIRKCESVIVAEGQFDVIISHEYGFTNTIGVGGTAISAQQYKILSRFAKKIIVVFDGDEAGRRALEKVKTKELKGLDITTGKLPDNEDIDSFLQSQGAEAYQKLLASAV